MSEYKEFNELPFETRKMICYYTDLFEIQMLEQILGVYEDDITPRLRDKLKELANAMKQHIK